MDLFAFIVSLCVLGAVAMRFGRDSREPGLRSEEERLANFGMAWGAKPPQPRPTRMRRPHAYMLRHLIAVALYRLAHWLAPEMSRAAG